MNLIFITHSPVGQQNWFSFLVLVNKAAINMGCKYLCGRLWGSLHICPGVRQLTDALFFIFLRNLQIEFHNDCINLYPH